MGGGSHSLSRSLILLVSAQFKLTSIELGVTLRKTRSRDRINNMQQRSPFCHPSPSLRHFPCFPFIIPLSTHTHTHTHTHRNKRTTATADDLYCLRRRHEGWEHAIRRQPRRCFNCATTIAAAVGDPPSFLLACAANCTHAPSSSLLFCLSALSQLPVITTPTPSLHL